MLSYFLLLMAPSMHVIAYVKSVHKIFLILSKGRALNNN